MRLYLWIISQEDNGPDQQVLDLPAGWSMFSTYMLADDMALDAILSNTFKCNHC